LDAGEKAGSFDSEALLALFRALALVEKGPGKNEAEHSGVGQKRRGVRRRSWRGHSQVERGRLPEVPKEEIT